ncbi:RTA1 like protein-domain-containing protein [Leucosporidium creatinivorum]|uniref:RTA1 like protein-domain-containing protein n=1 Tax=Leucosporidium creatinivorum TaxID=106004 RepID=A0A1Y2G0X2_9BASI|nr:RTA1 like protein-domain-containing protein [Leucosporidium creatinivorum]
MLSFKQALAAFLVVSCYATGALAYTPEFNDDGTPKRPVAGYVPKVWPCVVAIVLWGFTAVVAWTHWFRMGRQRYLLTLTISLLTMVLGYALRIGVANSPYSVGMYAFDTLLILLSPCAFLAVNYMLLTRLAQSLGEEVTKKCLFLPHRVVVKLFVWVDVICFLLQGSGGGMTAMEGNIANIGHDVSLAGLIIQVISYGFFSLLLLTFIFRVRKNYPSSYYASNSEGWSALSLLKKTPVTDWRILAHAMVLSSVGVMVRCIFRIAEYSGGYDSYLATKEGYFYLLDSLPLWLAFTLYLFLWPARFIGANEIAPNFIAHHNNLEMGTARPIVLDNSYEAKQ